MLQQTPLFETHVRLGARMVPFAGYDMPVQYYSILEEHRHTRKAASLFDVSHMGPILIEKNKAHFEALERCIPLDLESLDVGQTAYNVLLNPDGGIADDLLMTAYADHWMIVLNAGRKVEDMAYLRTFLELDELKNHVLIALQGPKARAVLASILPSCASMYFLSAQTFTYEGSEGWLNCSGYTGEDGFEIILEAPAGRLLFEKLLSHEDVKPAGLGARDSLRLEAGLCLYGHDLDAGKTLSEASLIWVMGKKRREKADFFGAPRVLNDIKHSERYRVGLSSNERTIAREGALIFNENGKEIGIVTSGTHSPTLGHPIVMGYVDVAYRAIESRVYIHVRGNAHPFHVTKMPFVPTNYYRG